MAIQKRRLPREKYPLGKIPKIGANGSILFEKQEVMGHKISHDSETPAQGKQIITACAFIYHDFDGIKKVFLPKRAETKKFLPGVYELPGGHIDFGEDIIDGLKREIREEFEMDIEVGDTLAAFTYMNKIKGSHSIEVVYFAQFKDDVSKIKINPSDHSEFKWIAKDEVEEILTHGKNIDDSEIQTIRKGFEKLTTISQSTVRE